VSLIIALNEPNSVRFSGGIGGFPDYGIRSMAFFRLGSGLTDCQLRGMGEYR